MFTFSVVFLLTFGTLTLYAQDADWRQIVVGQSTQADVERILGQPRQDTLKSTSVLAFFDVANGLLTVTYSTGLCKPSDEGGWNIEKGVVDEITFHFGVYPKFKSLKLDKKKYQKTIEGDVSDTFTYVNEDDGIKYIVKYGKVKIIVFYPGKKYDNIRCSKINNLNN